MNWIEHLLRLDNETPARKTLKKLILQKTTLKNKRSLAKICQANSNDELYRSDI